jgi:hypothetical protein
MMASLEIRDAIDRFDLPLVVLSHQRHCRTSERFLRLCGSILLIECDSLEIVYVLFTSFVIKLRHSAEPMRARDD